MHGGAPWYCNKVKAIILYKILIKLFPCSFVEHRATTLVGPTESRGVLEQSAVAFRARARLVARND